MKQKQKKTKKNSTLPPIGNFKKIGKTIWLRDKNMSNFLISCSQDALAAII